MTRILRRVPWQAPVVITSVADVARALRGLGAKVPVEHLELLRDQDGFEANGLQVFGTTRRPLRGGTALPSLDDTALDLEGGELAEHLVLAQGSSAFYAVHRRTGAFHELDIVPAQVLARHAMYADLLGRAVDAQS
jgi:hypothetical protein